jgi:hypothetical protein
MQLVYRNNFLKHDTTTNKSKRHITGNSLAHLPPLSVSPSLKCLTLPFPSVPSTRVSPQYLYLSFPLSFLLHCHRLPCLIESLSLSPLSLFSYQLLIYTTRTICFICRSFLSNLSASPHLSSPICFLSGSFHAISPHFSFSIIPSAFSLEISFSLSFFLFLFSSICFLSGSLLLGCISSSSSLISSACSLRLSLPLFYNMFFPLNFL